MSLAIYRKSNSFSLVQTFGFAVWPSVVLRGEVSVALSKAFVISSLRSSRRFQFVQVYLLKQTVMGRISN